MAHSTLVKPSGSSLRTMATSSRSILARFDNIKTRFGHVDLQLADPGKRVVYVRNPGSLHASLDQLKSELRSTFDVAEQKMGAVRKIFQGMPEVFTEIQDILSKGKTVDHKKVNPLVKKIGSRWQVCLEHTKYCNEHFKNARLLLEEMRELCAVKACSLKKKMDKLSLKKKQLKSEASTKTTQLKRLQEKVNKAKDLVAAKREKNEAAIAHKAALVSGGAVVVLALITNPIVMGPALAAAVALIALTAKELRVAERNLADEERRHQKCKDEIKEIKNKIDKLKAKIKELEDSRKTLISLNKFLGESSTECARAMQMWVDAESFFQEVADRVAQRNNSRVIAFLSASSSMMGKVMSWLKLKHLMKKGQAAQDELRDTEDMLC